VPRRSCVWGVGGAPGAPADQQGWSVGFGLAKHGCQPEEPQDCLVDRGRGSNHREETEQVGQQTKFFSVYLLAESKRYLLTAWGALNA